MAVALEVVTTRQRILDATDRLFYREGIRAVTVDQIAADLGISKKTLYRFFPSKSELIVAYLKGRFRPLPVRPDRHPAQQILENFDYFARGMATGRADRGCAFANALVELGEDQTEARALAIQFKDARRQWFRDRLAELAVDDPDTLANQLALLIDGAYSATLVPNGAAMPQAAVAAARTLLKNAGVPIADFLVPAAANAS